VRWIAIKVGGRSGLLAARWRSRVKQSYALNVAYVHPKPAQGNGLRPKSSIAEERRQIRTKNAQQTIDQYRQQ
jgi:hypothetical protein